MTDISVVIPIGPDLKYLEFLPECIDSVIAQNPSSIVLINDQNSVSLGKLYMQDFHTPGWSVFGEEHYGLPGEKYSFRIEGTEIKVIYYKTLWNVGVADAFNFGVALAPADLVFMLGSDDKMLDGCLEEVVKCYETNNKKDAWYNVTIENATDGIMQIPNNTAAVTKDLWKMLGGFPPSAGVGAPDALLLSIMLKHMPDRIIQVAPGVPLCWLREGPHQDTRKNSWLFNDEIISIRNKETNRWKAQD